MSQFASPASQSTLTPADVLNHLLLIKPTAFKSDVPTANGPSDTITCDVADLSTGIFYEGVMWFSRVLVSALQARINQMVLAAMAQGQAKPGQSPPWILIDAANDPNAVATAQAWLAQNPTFDPSRPNVASPATPNTTPYVNGYNATPAPAPAYQQPASAPQAPAYQAPQAPAAAYQAPTGVDPATV